MPDPPSDTKAELQRAAIADALYRMADEVTQLPTDKGIRYFASLVAQVESLRKVLEGLRRRGR